MIYPIFFSQTLASAICATKHGVDLHFVFFPKSSGAVAKLNCLTEGGGAQATGYGGRTYEELNIGAKAVDGICCCSGGE